MSKCPECGLEMKKYTHGDFPDDPFLRCDNPECTHAWEVYSITFSGGKGDKQK